MGHVLIAGCGYLGTALGVRLAAEGHVVWGLSRSPGELPTSIRGIEGDLGVPNTLRNLPAVDWVFYLAGGGHAGVRYLLGALAAGRQRITRLFYGSGLDVYGHRGGEWVDEDSAVAPATARAREMHESEQLVAAAPWPSTAVRLGEVYGPSRLGVLGHVMRGEPVAVPAPAAHVSPIHRDDAVGALVHLLGRRESEAVYLLVDRTPVPRVEMLEWLGSRTGRGLPPLTESAEAHPDVRAMSDRLVETGFAFCYPSFREGFVPLLSRLGR